MEPATKQDLFEWMAALIAILILLTGLLAVHIQNCHQKEMEVLEEIKAKSDKREALDAAYREHLGKCSFLNKDSIYITEQGDVRSKYRRGYATTK